MGWICGTLGHFSALMNCNIFFARSLHVPVELWAVTFSVKIGFISYFRVPLQETVSHYFSTLCFKMQRREINPHGRLLCFYRSHGGNSYMLHVLYAPRHSVLNLFMTGLRTMDRRPRGFTPIFINNFIALADGSQTISYHNTLALLVALCFASNRIIWWIERWKRARDTLFKSFADRRVARHLLDERVFLVRFVLLKLFSFSDGVDFNNLSKIITNLLVCA